MPDWKEVVRRRLARSGLAPEREAEIVEELSQHLEDSYEQALAGGATEEEARAAALRGLADSDLLAQELRRVERVRREPLHERAPRGRRMRVFGDLWQDVRYGLRVLTKNPGFTAVAVVALALGIGANSAIFSVVNAVLLRPLPYEEPERLVMVWEEASRRGFPRDTPAPANFVDWREQNQVFEGMAAIADASFNLTGAGDPERITGKKVSANFFSLLGVEPKPGRAFLPEEDQPGSHRVAVISHGLWQRRFGSDEKLVGGQISLNGEPHTVVGVLPPNFEFMSREDEIWVPIAFTQQQAAARGSHYLFVVARMKPGVTVEQADAEMRTIGARLSEQYPNTNKDRGAEAVGLHEQLVGDIRPALLVLLGAVGFVLLVACANVANLLLARAATRQKEIALRVALGAGRLRLVRQFLTESLLLATVGGAVGLLLSVWGLSVLRAFIPPNISQAGAITIDAKVLGFTLLVSLLTGLVFGLAPALQASNFNLNETLKEGGRDSVAGRRGNRIRGLLVVTEVAVSLVLLIGAGLLINSFVRLSSVDPGFRVENLLTMNVVLPISKYPDGPQRALFYTELLRRVESLPGVRAAAVTTNLPLYRQGNSVGISVEGVQDPAPGQGERPSVAARVISPRYFETMGIPMLRGRGFEARDRVDSPCVVVVSEAMVRRFWPGQNALGKRVTPGSPDNPEHWCEVVGIVGDVRQFELGAEPKPLMYFSYEQAAFFAPRDMVVRAEGDPLALAGAVRKAVWEVDRDQPVSNVNTMEGILSESIARQRFSMLLLGIFASVALVLAAVGIYGVMSYSVAQRTREIGIRMALGAKKGDILKLVLGRGVRLALIGVTVGIAAAFALTRLMTALLFGVSSTDPATYGGIAALLLAVALAACYFPARRAFKVDPLVALRYE